MLWYFGYAFGVGLLALRIGGAMLSTITTTSIAGNSSTMTIAAYLFVWEDGRTFFQLGL